MIATFDWILTKYNGFEYRIKISDFMHWFESEKELKTYFNAEDIESIITGVWIWWSIRMRVRSQ